MSPQYRRIIAFSVSKCYIISTMDYISAAILTIAFSALTLGLLWVFMWTVKEDAVLRNWLLLGAYLCVLMAYKNLSGTDLLTAISAGAVVAAFVLAAAGLAFLPKFDSAELGKVARQVLILTLILGVTSVIARAVQASF